MTHRAAAASLIAAVLACGGPSATAVPAAPGSAKSLPPRGAPESVPVASDAYPEGSPEDLVGDDPAWHARAREAVAKGDLYVAKRILLRLVAGYRRDRLLAAQFEWVARRLEADAQPARDAMKRTPLGGVPLLPTSFRFQRAASVAPRPTPKLVLRSQTRNQITDEAAWFRGAGPLGELALPPEDTLLVMNIDLKDAATDGVLARITASGWLEDPPASHVRSEPFPSWIPPTYGSAGLARAIRSDAHTILVYGNRTLLVFDDERHLIRALDLFLLHYPDSHRGRPSIKVGALTVTSPDGSVSGDLTVKDHGPRHQLRWAEVRDGVLYLATSYDSYAKDVKGQHAYVTAVDLATGDVLFRSAPLSSNSRNLSCSAGRS